MQENNVIYEIAEKIQDKQIVQNDFKEAFSLVTNMFKSKYIDKLEDELKVNINNVKNNPTKEITLLNAIKPFMKENKQKNLDDIVDMMTSISAISYMLPKQNDEPNIIKINSITKQDSSVKEDGVYDIDESCMFNTNNKPSFNNNFIYIILFLILFNM